MTGGVAPGWYPDYEAPPGHQRYWDGERWTERRSAAPGEAAAAAPVTQRLRSRVPTVAWVAAAAALVVTTVIVLVVGDDDTATSGRDAGSATPPASTPGPPDSEQTEPDAARRIWEVESAVDGMTLRLTNGAEVRLAGVADGCDTQGLAQLAVGRQVTLTRRGPDKDAEGRLLRYVEREGIDIGLRLIQRGWATASADAHPRRAIYRRVDARSPDVCG